MVAFGCVRELSFVALIACVALAGCKSEEKKATEAVPSRALEAANVAAPQDPEPEVHPCKYCTVDVNKRVSGTWQPAGCFPGTGEVVYPVASPTIEVLGGPQKGKEFLVNVAPASFAAGDSLVGTLPADAEVAGWVEARLWVKGAGGVRCSSLLSIQR